MIGSELKKQFHFDLISETSHYYGSYHDSDAQQFDKNVNFIPHEPQVLN